MHEFKGCFKEAAATYRPLRRYKAVFVGPRVHVLLVRISALMGAGEFLSFCLL